jgi:hypothetical protein
MTARQLLRANPIEPKGGRFERRRVRSPAKFDPRSFRVIDPGRPGRTKLVLACPRGAFDPKRGCRRGMVLQAILRERA